MPSGRACRLALTSARGARGRSGRPAPASHQSRCSRYQRDGRAQPALEGVARRPAELAADLRRVDRVAAIVARADPARTSSARDSSTRRRAPGSTPAAAARRARRRCGRRSRGSSARCRRRYCTSRPARPFAQHQQQARAVILDVQPVADVAAVAVDRQRPPVERVQDHQRNQLLGKLIRPVVVRAVRDEHRQAVGVEVRAHQVIGRRLARRVRRIRRVRRLLAEQPARRRACRTPRRSTRAGTGTRSRVGGRERRDERARRLEQHERADDVGVDERPRDRRSTDRRASRPRGSARRRAGASANTRAIASRSAMSAWTKVDARIVERAARG